MLALLHSCFHADKKTIPIHEKGPALSVKGISLVAPPMEVGDSIFTPIIHTGANSIAVMPYAFCSTENPVVNFNRSKQWWGERNEGVVKCIQMARQKGLTVMLKPHLWMSHGTYTGAFTLPTNEQWLMWENSYQQYLLNFAHIADSLSVEIFCIGTELGAAVKARPLFWSNLVDTIRQVYKGRLTYAANWDDYALFPFWNKLDYIGIDAYFPLAAGKQPSIKKLKESWRPHAANIEKLSKAVSLPVLFTEFGYRNADEAAKEPWKENAGNQNDAAQSDALHALFETFSGKEWFAGGYIWKWYAHQGRRPRSTIDFTPQEKPALKVLAYWYNGDSISAGHKHPL